MAAKPILIKSSLVSMVLAGRKTQTRRLIKPQPPGGWGGTSNIHALAQSAPYRVGDRLWIRDTWALARAFHDPDTGYPDEFETYEGYGPIKEKPEWYRVFYDADFRESALHKDDRWIKRWRPSTHMPKWAARPERLRVTEVRVQRIQDISAGDCIAEGIKECDGVFEIMVDGKMSERLTL